MFRGLIVEHWVFAQWVKQTGCTVYHRREDVRELPIDHPL